MYLLIVDGKPFYYGQTTDMVKRKKEHIREVGQLMKSGDYKLLPVQTKKLKVHHKIAAYILRFNKWGTSTSRIKFHICFVANDLITAKEVELFLIKNSLKHNNSCCNTKTSY